jgi:hypothetical protein
MLNRFMQRISLKSEFLELRYQADAPDHERGAADAASAQLVNLQTLPARLFGVSPHGRSPTGVFVFGSVLLAVVLRPFMAGTVFRLVRFDRLERFGTRTNRVGFDDGAERSDCAVANRPARQRRPPTRSYCDALDSEGDVVSLSIRPDCWV